MISAAVSHARWATRLVVIEVGRVPGEPVAERVPLDAQLAADLLLADLPLAALDELQHGDRPAHGDRAEHHTERRAALALAVAGVDQQQRAGARQRRRGEGRRWVECRSWTVEHRHGQCYRHARSARAECMESSEVR